MSAPEHEATPPELTPQELSRRDFLKRAAGASAIALTGVGLAAALLDANGPPASDPVGAATSAKGLGDYSLPELRGKPGRMAIVRGVVPANSQAAQPDRKAMLERALAALGGLGAFIKPGDRVLLKVNAAFATSPLLGATTHPDLVAAVTSLCLAAGAASVALTDNPVHSPESCFALTGISEAAAKSGAKVILPGENLFVPVSVPPSGNIGGRLIRDWPTLAGPFKGVTKVIALSPVKDHRRAGASMTLKNFYGLLGGRRNVFHQDINGIIAELALLVRPTLCVLDGVTVMLTNGPTGGSLSDLKAMHVMAVTTDPVAADSFGMELLGRAVTEAPYIKLAETAGAGNADYKALNPQFLDLGA
ncbi:MAG: DUF362 domain-containing protein [Proteobacteria bacterium]|nr:DUF362 domain-containing protein [Pseudomonadota bacterium]